MSGLNETIGYSKSVGLALVSAKNLEMFKRCALQGDPIILF